jgi:hypothetical protein
VPGWIRQIGSHGQVLADERLVCVSPKMAMRSKRAGEISTLGNDALGRSAWLANARLSDGITVMGGTRARPTVLAS